MSEVGEVFDQVAHLAARNVLRHVLWHRGEVGATALDFARGDFDELVLGRAHDDRLAVLAHDDAGDVGAVLEEQDRALVTVGDAAVGIADRREQVRARRPGGRRLLSSLSAWASIIRSHCASTYSGRAALGYQLVLGAPAAAQPNRVDRR